MWENILKQDFVVKQGLKDADFWIQRVGSRNRAGSMHMNWPINATNGKPFHPTNVIGVKVINPDINSDEVARFYGKLYRTGQIDQYIMGSVQQAIRVSDVKQILNQFNKILQVEHELSAEDLKALEKLPKMVDNWKKQSRLISQLMKHSDTYHRKGLDLEKFLEKM
tara:strand:- start:264 stop:761 length:498 start_codon:yes stop_codon:yes gene_type:complete